MNPPPIASLLPALLATVALAAGPARAQDDRIEVPVDGSQPVNLTVQAQQPSIEVVAGGGSQVVVELVSGNGDDMERDHDGDDGDEGDEEEDDRRRGLRRISAGHMGIDVNASGNTVEVQGGWGADGLVRVRVPERSNLTLHSLNGDSIVVRGVRGTIQINSQNGDIEATGVRGSLVVNATNGNVTAEVLSLDAGAQLSLISFNGDIDATLPASFQADVRLSSMQGEIYTDFDLQRLPSEPEVERKEGKVRYRVEREIRGRIGAGGGEARFKTWNGDIYLRRGK